MAREMKFRAWDKENNHMVYSDGRDEKDRDCYYDFIVDKNNVKCMSETDYDDKFGQPTTEVNEIDNIMQFTGIIDKMGNEIYEGDILAYYEDGFVRGYVEWRDYCYKIICKNRLDRPGKEEILVKATGYYVYGNIYEYPECLE